MKYETSVDQLKVCVVYKSHDNEEYKQLSGWTHSVYDQEFGPGKVWNPHQASSLTNVHVALKEGGYLFVRYGYLGKAFRVYYQFNPAKVSWWELEAHLSMLLDHGHHSLVQRATVSRCEFALDFHSVKFEEHLFLDTRVRKCCGALQDQGSHYLGASTAGRHCIAYDKRKELLEQAHIDLGHDQLRVEARIQTRGAVILKDLPKVPNPFASLWVLDAAKAKAELPSFLVNKLGKVPLQQAYVELEPKQRIQVRESLPSLAPAWWAPEKLWTDFHPDAFAWLTKWHEGMLAQLPQHPEPTACHSVQSNCTGVSQ